MSEAPLKRPGSPAASHMLWFFVLPILGLIGFATWKLSGALLNPEQLTLARRLSKLESAVNSGERWKEAYGVSQEVHRMRSRGEWEKFPASEKKALFDGLEKVLAQHSQDSRVSRYLLVTLGQLGERETLRIFERYFDSKDPELKFYSVWGYSQSMLASKSWELFSESTRAKFLQFLKEDDAEMKKILCAFLAQGNLADREISDSLKGLLKDANREVRWNAAVALLPKGYSEAEEVLLEMLSLEGLRSADFRTFSDMKQALSAARISIEKAANDRLRARARSFVAEVDNKTPEARAIQEALKGI
jgi:HEAT repeat protein